MRKEYHDYPNIRNIPKEAWKKKEWPITAIKISEPEPKIKEQEAKERLPYKDEDEVPF